MKKLIFLLILGFNLIQAQSFKSENIRCILKYDSIFINYGSIIEAYKTDSSVEITINRQMIYTYYLQGGHILSFSEDAIWLESYPSKKIYGKWNPTFYDAVLDGTGQVVSQPFHFPPYDMYDTVFYYHPHRVIKF